ncbi:hypothetical protein DPMN_034914 [Dreissena polymorpha]|uniref:Uncharacterized protein n=1 Tax=Dreissena polymorpha TaxID=45954 RepID=A0A9D4M7P2_DREPO|nr:hypothetical protein DPMN_034914 [Dreissena polymorpha]
MRSDGIATMPIYLLTVCGLPLDTVVETLLRHALKACMQHNHTTTTVDYTAQDP